ncbi:hypothetical protein H0E87_010611 [Populus deltoides]|uniref:Uncharacterized protein n=1 Tax=Populus deltoides TaxID=3696 RepID=A0A8T2YU28_POPDE|nr:hypothetical protein H0E87_010611 [Populus deltoides]
MIFQSDGAIENLLKDQNSGLKDTQDDNLKEWLSLSLGRNEPAATAGDCDPEAKPAASNKNDDDNNRILLQFSFGSITWRPTSLSYVHKPSREAASSMVARFGDASSDFGLA